jgi:serine/threonine protein kinase
MNAQRLDGPDRNGQYIEIQFYASGGMGDIYSAKDSESGNEVAIKLIRIDDTIEKDLLEEEFKIAIQFRHPNIIDTYYYSEFSDSTGNFFYSVMAINRRGNLAKLLKSSSTFLDLEDCYAKFIQLLDGLQEAHKKIIHRDLKPENILVDEDGTLRITDFGISKYVDNKTRTRTFKGYGSLPYMSPECWLFDTNSIQMDIYSLGIIFFEILTLKKPFRGTTDQEIREQHLYQPLPRLSVERSDIPILISDIVQKMANKRPTDRYQSAEEVKKALLSALASPRENGDNYDKILKNAQTRIEKETEQSLVKSKIQDSIREKNTTINYSISRLFDQFKEVAQAVNNLSQNEKITFRPFIVPGNPHASTCTLNYFDRRIIVQFYNENLQDYIKNRKKAQVDFQVEKWGMVIQGYEPDSIEKDRVIIIGEVAMNYNLPSGYPLGFNVVLCQTSEDDIYGEWRFCKFIDTPMFANVSFSLYYCIPTPKFFAEYDFGRRNVTNVRYMRTGSVSREDISDLISYMPSL